MIEDFRLPDLGEGLPEAEIVAWLVAEGDTVTLNQTIAEVETAKAVVELPSPHAGRITKLHAAAGDVVEVGSVLISFDLGGDSAPGTPPATEEKQSDEPAKAEPNLVGYGAAPRGSARPQRRSRAAAGRPATSDTAVLEAAPHDAIQVADERPLERPRSTPPVRLFAKQLGVDLALVEATGASGIITRADVEAYAERVGATPVSSAPAPEPEFQPELRIAAPRGSAPRARRSGECASTPPRRWCAAPSPPRTSRRSSPSTSRRPPSSSRRSRRTEVSRSTRSA
nr:hypothetical protein GCM10025699_28060 [Microbacterium flavescens]